MNPLLCGWGSKLGLVLLSSRWLLVHPFSLGTASTDRRRSTYIIEEQEKLVIVRYGILSGGTEGRKEGGGRPDIPCYQSASDCSLGKRLWNKSTQWSFAASLITSRGNDDGGVPSKEILPSISFFNRFASVSPCCIRPCTCVRIVPSTIPANAWSDDPHILLKSKRSW